VRSWFRALLCEKDCFVSRDAEGTHSVHVWLVTDDIGDGDASSRVVYDATRKMFGLVMELPNGVLWYMGPSGSLVDTVQII